MKHCEDCKKEIPIYGFMHGNGYQSQSVVEWKEIGFHITRTGKKQVMNKPIHKELCLECYRIDWAKVYPETSCQV